MENIPSSARRDFFIYLLDYGWNEPISNSLRDNFDRMAQIAAKNKAVIIKGVGRAIVDSIILEPNFSGIGFSFNKLKDYLK